MATNWAGNITYLARGIHRPGSVEELQALVASSDRVRALGSRHSFTALPDSPGELVQLDGLPAGIEIDGDDRCVSVGAGVRYGELAEHLHRAGWALANLASLPHISVAGAVATGTHGSGDRNKALSAAVRALDLVGPDGDLRTWRRGDPDFDGTVVSLGVLGVVTRLVLDVEPTFEVSSTQFTGLGWDALDEHFDAITAAAYSVSLFTRWSRRHRPGVGQEPRGDTGDGAVRRRSGDRDAAHARRCRPAGGDPAARRTRARGTTGCRTSGWSSRPSRGEELQSEYLLPRDQARPAIAFLRELGSRLAPVLQVTEIRTVAADDSWLSGAYARDAVGLHFTWVRDVPARVRRPAARRGRAAAAGGTPALGQVLHDDGRGAAPGPPPAARLRPPPRRARPGPEVLQPVHRRTAARALGCRA